MLHEDTVDNCHRCGDKLEQYDIALEKVSLISRLAAISLDIAALLAFSYLIIAIFITDGWDLPYPSRFAVILVAVVLSVGILILLRDIIGGRSLGKRLLGIRVGDLKDNSRTPSAWALIQRQVTLVLFFPIEVYLLLFHKSKRRLGDHFGNCQVYYEEHREKWLLRDAAIILICVIAAYAFAPALPQHIAQTSHAYQLAVSIIGDDLYIREALGSAPKIGPFPLVFAFKGEGVFAARVRLEAKGIRGSLDIDLVLGSFSGRLWEGYILTVTGGGKTITREGYNPRMVR